MIRTATTLGIALAAGALPAVGSAERAAPSAEPAAVVDRFLQTLRRGRHNRLGQLVGERVATSEGRSLSREQIRQVYLGYTALMFGPLRSYRCDTPARNAVTCRLDFQSRWLRERYTVEAGLISAIEVLPASEEETAK